MTAFTLVHSPLVGPRTWWPVRDELLRRGHDVAVPSLVDAATAGDHREIVRAAVTGAHRGADRVLVGHSGAGLLLPLIAAAMDSEPAAIVFVDSALPPTAGPIKLLPDDLLTYLTPLVIDGRLPPWSEWFGDTAMAALVPDSGTRAALTAELPRLPLAYFQTTVDVPPGWRALESRYLLLSAPYAPDAREAAHRGWPVIEHPSTHLAIVTDARAVTDAILALFESG